MSASVGNGDPVATDQDPPSITTSTKGEEKVFGGLTAREASMRAVAARAARRASQEGTTSQKIARAFDSLTQSDWDRAVKGALGNASGMQALTRLLDRVAGAPEVEETEEGLSPAERQAALDLLRTQVSQARGEGGVHLSVVDSVSVPREEAGGEGEGD